MGKPIGLDCAKLRPVQRIKWGKKKPTGKVGFCGTTGIRTWDTRIFNPLLYQLSYSTEVGRKDKMEVGMHRPISIFFS